jgi:hypothetical protein
MFVEAPPLHPFSRLGAGSPGRSLLRSTLPGRGHGGRRAVTTDEPRGAPPAPRSLSEEDPARARRAVTRTRLKPINTGDRVSSNGDVKTYRPYGPDQSYPLPPSSGEWLPTDETRGCRPASPWTKMRWHGRLLADQSSREDVNAQRSDAGWVRREINCTAGWSCAGRSWRWHEPWVAIRWSTDETPRPAAGRPLARKCARAGWERDARANPSETRRMVIAPRSTHRLAAQPRGRD